MTLNPIIAVIGNPPYSAGQRSENYNNKNIKYPKLDKKIQDTYVKYSSAKMKGSLYDSYKRAIRLATDRLKKAGHGIVSFVTNGSFLESNADDGLRKNLVKEYDSIYVFNLRGNARTTGELGRMEGGQIFNAASGVGGSRAPICISLFVLRQDGLRKEAEEKPDAKIYYYDIGDYKTRAEKLNLIREFGSFSNLPMVEIIPNKYADWLNQRNNPEYETYTPLGSKNKNYRGTTIFANYTRGIGTCRDAWVYNFSPDELAKNVKNTIDCYNSEIVRLANTVDVHNIDDFVTPDSTKISWSASLKKKLQKRERLFFHDDNKRTV